MKITNLHTDDAILAEIGERLASHRLQRNQTQADLALDAGVSKRTLERIEAGHSAQVSSIIRILRALDRVDGLEQLIPEPGPSPMQALKHGNRTRQRASTPSAEPEAAEPWTWGDEG